jgi:hypothetical protein
MKPLNRFLFWTPRVLTMAFILFLGMFAMDVFEGPESIARKLVGLLIHLIPNFMLILVLIASWKREWIGATLFSALGVFYFIWSLGRFPWDARAFITGPLLLAGVLFLLGWIDRRRKTASTPG